MLMHMVRSANVKAVGHNPITNELFIEFKGSGLYVYEGVPSEEFERLMGAPGIGRYLARHIKDRYRFRRLSTDG